MRLTDEQTAECLALMREGEVNAEVLAARFGVTTAVILALLVEAFTLAELEEIMTRAAALAAERAVQGGCLPEPGGAAWPGSGLPSARAQAGTEGERRPAPEAGLTGSGPAPRLCSGPGDVLSLPHGRRATAESNDVAQQDRVEAGPCGVSEGGFPRESMTDVECAGLLGLALEPDAITLACLRVHAARLSVNALSGLMPPASMAARWAAFDELQAAEAELARMEAREALGEV